MSRHERLETDGVAGRYMRQPAICIDEHDTIGHAAAMLAREDIHHLIVVNPSGVARTLPPVVRVGERFRFRAASVRDEDEDEDERQRIASMLRDEADHLPPVGAT